MSKYRSLADVYSDNAFKPLPKLQRQRVIGEKVEVYFKSELENRPELIGSVDNEDAKNLRRKIINMGGVTKTLAEILITAGWRKNNEDFLTYFIGPIAQIIEKNSDVNPAEFKKMYKSKKTQTEFLSMLQTAADNNTYFDVLKPLVNVAYPSFGEDTATVVKKIVNYKTSGGERTGVGKGEIAITMFSNAVKGEESSKEGPTAKGAGDLYFPNYGMVELKGTDGRPGKDGSPGNSIQPIEKFLINKNNNISTGRSIRRNLQQASSSKTEIIKKIKELKKQKRYINKKEFYDPKLEAFENLLNQIHGLKEIDQAATGFNELQQFINSNNLNGLPFAKENLISNYRKDLFNYLNSRVNKIVSDKNDTTTTEVWQTAFLTNFGLEKSDYIDMLLLTKNETKVGLKPYKEGLNEILTNEVIEDLTLNHNRTILEAIIGALHTCMYQERDNFKAIVYYSNTSYNALPITFENSSKENFVNTYYKFLDLLQAGNITIGLSVDSQNHGVSISFKQ